MGLSPGIYGLGFFTAETQRARRFAEGWLRLGIQRREKIWELYTYVPKTVEIGLTTGAGLGTLLP